MNRKIRLYIDKILEVKGGSEEIYGIPTDIIGFDEFGRELASSLEKYVSKKEICFFDEDIKVFSPYHYLEFKDMFKKSELMIFTKELPLSYFSDLSGLNKNITLVVDKNFKGIINVLITNGFGNNLLVI